MRWIPPVVGGSVFAVEIALSLVAQAAGSSDAGDWIRDLTTAWGPVAALAWYLYYTTSITFPRISQQHLDQLSKLDQEHRSELHKAMDAWRDELRTDRQEFRRALAEIMEVLRSGGWAHQEPRK